MKNNIQPISIVINTYNRKDYLIQLLTSIMALDLKKVKEIIVVDDCSDDKYGATIKKLFPKVQFIQNKRRMFLIKSRNQGWKKTIGEIIFFVDDDNEIYDTQFFNKAVNHMDLDDVIGIIGCRAYYHNNKNLIFVGANSFNFYTGKTVFHDINQTDTVSNVLPIQTHDTPNAFFVRRDVLEKKDGFDETIVQTFSEADLAQKARLLEYKVIHDPRLKVFHKSEPIDFKHLTPRQMGGSPERFYFLMRNRYLFIGKYGNTLQKFTFVTLFSHVYTAYYMLHITRNKEFGMLRTGILGVRDGYIYILFNHLRRSV